MTIPSPFIHLVASPGQPADLLAVVEAANAAGEVASLVAPAALLRDLVGPVQKLGIAVLSKGDPGAALATGADGIEIVAQADYEVARRMLGPDRIVGARCGDSRHHAMELAEAGADYVAFRQKGHEELIGWWSSIFEVPCIAWDPVSAEELDLLLPHQPDFIRPSEEMWSSPERAKAIVAELRARLSR